VAAYRGSRRGAPGRGKPGRSGTGRARTGGSSTDGGNTARDTARRAGLPRRTAYDVLTAVEARQAYANLLLPRLLTERGVTGRDAALATELTYGTLRGLGTYDAVLAACSDRPLDKLDPPVLQVLRLGAHQLLATRVGAHAAVATSVDLAKAVAGARVSGYVNAVLRRVATRDLDAWLGLVAPDPVTDPDGSLAVRYSYPRWIVAAYRDALGAAAETELEAALAAGNDRPRVTLAAFPGGPSRDEIMPPGAEPTRWSPYGFTLPGGDPSALVADGTAAVQDEGSQLAAIALASAPLDGPDTRWLDMCAGPGGKARLLYGLAERAGASLTAADLHPHRAALVRDALARAPRPGSTGEEERFPATFRRTADGDLPLRPGAAVVAADGRHPPWLDAVFDRVLLDVPCSGLGALRRRPEARWRKSESDLADLGALQRALLRSALAACRPGGVVAYVTCSPVLAETREVVAEVAGSDPATDILDAPAALATVPGLRSPDPRLAQFWPHRHATDAIFVALLRRGPALANPGSHQQGVLQVGEDDLHRDKPWVAEEEPAFRVVAPERRIRGQRLLRGDVVHDDAPPDADQAGQSRVVAAATVAEQQVERSPAGQDGGGITGDDLHPPVTGQQLPRGLGPRRVDLGGDQRAVGRHRSGHPRRADADARAHLADPAAGAPRGEHGQEPPDAGQRRRRPRARRLVPGKREANLACQVTRPRDKRREIIHGTFYLSAACGETRSGRGAPGFRSG
jgi:16S rRNA (cytosine967-C5)-methyltransferase